MKKFNTVIFDLDGTLLDSSRGIISSIEYTVKHLNMRKLNDSELQSCIGPPIQNSFQRVYKIKKSDADYMAEIFRKHYMYYDLFKAEVYDEIFDGLKKLKDKGLLLGVATYKREDYTKRIMDHFMLSPYFDVIIGSDFGGNLSKTDIILKCINDLSADRKKTVMIGDTIHDFYGAQEAGIGFIGVTYGFGFKSYDELRNYEAIGFCENPTQIIEMLRINDISSS